MSHYREPQIVINEEVLTRAQAMTVRVACSDFALWLNSPDVLGNDEQGKAMREGYLKALSGVFQAIGKSGNYG